MNIYVGNLAFEVTDGELEAAFAQHGTVSSARVISDRESGRSRGFGFVEMGNDDEAKAAMAALTGTEIKGRAIVANEAGPREDRGPRY
jgi:RNA recognition motif-containing protein